MEGGTQNPASRNSEGSLVSLTASSMINASDMISADAYQANLKRIQEIKEIVKRLEDNNDTAHKNFLMHQLQKRVQDGREAEETLARLRNSTGVPDNVHHPTNNHQHDVILPSTATVVEVPESSAQRSSPLHGTPVPQNLHPPHVQQHPTQQHQSFRHYKFVPQEPASSSLHGQPDSTSRQYAPRPPSHSHPQATGHPGQYVFPINGYPRQAAPTTQRYNPAWTAYVPYQQQQQQQQQQQAWNAYMTTGQQYVAGHPGSVAQHATPSSQGGMPPPVLSRQPPPQVNIPQARSVSVQSRPPVVLPPRDPGTQGQRTSYTAAAPEVRLAQTETSAHQFRGPSQTSSGSQLSHPPQGPPATATTQPAHPQPTHPQPVHPQLTYPQPVHPQPTHLNPSQSVGVPQASRPTPLAQNRRAQISQTDTQSQISQHPLSGGTQSTALPTSQSAVTKDLFILKFQQAVKAGPEYVRRLWTSAMRAGITTDWFVAAINTIPNQLWQQIQSSLSPSDAVKASVVATSNVQGVVPSATPLTSVQASQSPQNASQTIHLGPPSQVATSPAITAQSKYHADAQTVATPGKVALPTPGFVPPRTPEGKKIHQSLLPRTPQQADRSRLARDILRSLGRSVPMPVKGKDKADVPQVDRARHQQQQQETEEEIISDEEIAAQNPPIRPSVTSSPMTGVALPSNVLVTISSDSVTPIPVITQRAPPSSPAKPVLQPEVAPIPLQPPLPKPPTYPEEEPHQPGPVTIDLTHDDSTASAGTFSPKTATVSEGHARPTSPAIAADPTPQLENLTLDETRVQAGTEDVHMASPLLSSSGNVGPTPPPMFDEPAGTEATSSGSGAVLDARDNFPSKLPLFLPSPPNSPHASNHSSAPGPPETDDEAMAVESDTKPSLKRRSVDVDELETGTKAFPPLRVKKKRKQVYVLVPPPSPSLRKLIEKTKKKRRAISVDITSDSASDEEEAELRYNDFERVVIEESKTRLMERRCRWSGCDAILNCGYNLLAHLKQHSEGQKSPLHCNWKGCRKRFYTKDERDTHLERHAVLPLPCPFAGCDEEFDTPIEVMHHEMEHQSHTHGQPLVQKPTPKPFVPSIPAKLGRPPQRLPSYRVLPRRIIKSCISADRHAVVGPWVLWHIFSPVNLNMRKQNATMRGRPTRQLGDGDSTTGAEMQDEYDFLLAQSPTRSQLPRLEDLDSQLVTQFASHGLILWAPDPPKNVVKPSSRTTASTNDGPNVSVTDTAPQVLDATMDSTEAPQIESTESACSSSSSPAEPVSEEPISGVSVGNGEEEVVERMLVM